MGLFADGDKAETLRVELDSGWVEVRALITLGDRDFANRKASGKVTAHTNQKRNEAEVGYEWSQNRYISALLARMIVAWSEEAPINIENVERMSGRDTDTIMTALNERNKERDEEEAAPLGSSSTNASVSQQDSGASGLTLVGQEN